MRSAFAKTTVPARIDFPRAQRGARSLACWSLAVWAFWQPLGAAAEIGLHPDPVAGPVAQLFYQPVPFGSILRPGQPLLRVRMKKPLLEYSRAFADKHVTIDSNGVHFTAMAAGFAQAAPITMNLSDYLELGFAHTRNTRWQETVRRKQKVATARQGRGGRRRLEWKVPFPAPAPVRRFIGDEGSLRINGSHTATIAGKSQWTSGEVRTLAGRPSKFPALAMEQESKFTVEGSVGEAINVRIDQDSQQFGQGISGGLRDQLANQIKLDYKGNEDDIFQEIVAGNTTLALPHTRFVTFNQQHKGLFGIRAKGHLGPMAFTTIASHEKSESNRRSFRGGAQVDTFTVRDFDYIRNTYFFLGMRYRDRLTDFRQVASNQPRDLVRDDVIDESSLEVYVNDFNVNNDAELLAKSGLALVDRQDAELAVQADSANIECFDLNGAVDRTGCREQGTWHRLDPDNDYSLVREFGYIILQRQIQERHALAVKYRTVGGEEFGSGGDELQLRLIKGRDARADFPTWDLEWKNVYRIVRGFTRGRQFEADKIRVEVLEEVPGREPSSSQNGKPLLQVLGVDDHGQDQGTPPDRVIDADYIGLDGSRGHLIFPDLTPFSPGDVALAGLQNPVPEIYDSHQRRDKEEASRFLIQVVNSSGEQRINLSQGRLAGIDTESVEVRLNGKRLKRGVDYNVSFTGEVNFVGEARNSVADPGADLEITYESQDLLGIGSQQKTLLGARGEYEFWDGDGTVGGTMLYNNVRSIERRVRVGSEPARTIVWDLDVKARFDAPLLTRAVDALPLLKTVAKSDVSVHGEIAQSRPNLNTKGRGYIDDFEGSERPEILSVFRSRWTPASTPPDQSVEDRGRVVWYNPFNRVLRVDIWPRQEDQIEAQNNKTDVLVMELDAGGNAAWGGLMASWTAGVRDFSQSKFLEVWVNGTQGTLHVDLGAISEDWIQNGTLDTEDIPFPGRRTGDGQVSQEEDVGIDRRDDEEELAYYLELAGVDTSGLSAEQMRQQFNTLDEYDNRDARDPEGDNWHYDSSRNRNDYSRINGTQGNRDTETGIRPDTEDLNNDGIVNNSNDYYHHEIDLSDNGHVPGSESPMGWRLYRRPLYNDAVVRFGSPDSSRIEYGRLLLSGAPSLPDTILSVAIAQIEIIGNDWQEEDIARLEGGLPIDPEGDESFNVTVIGTDESLTYRPPPGVKVRRLARSLAREREQSLVLEYENLEAGHQAAATKVLSGKADYTKYTRLKMFVHGDSTDTYVVDADSSEIELFVRFGRDSTNYYEFATQVYPGWDGRNEVEIDLLQMAQLKARLQEGRVDSLGNRLALLDTTIVHPQLRDAAPAIYRVRGNPSLQQIKQLAIGVRNRSALQTYSGRVYTDELRLDDARNDAGLAAFMRVNSGVADLMNVDASIDWQGEDFRTISNTGRNNSDFKTSLNATANLHKFLPGSWGFSMPLKVTYSRKSSLPRFGPNSDVELTSEQKQRLKGEGTKQLYEVSVSKRSSNNWVTRWSLDQMNFRISQTRERGFSPTKPRETKDNWNLSYSYKAPLPKSSLSVFAWLPGFAPEDWRASRLRYLPTSLNYNMSVNRRDSEIWRRTNDDNPEFVIFNRISGRLLDSDPRNRREIRIEQAGDTLTVPVEDVTFSELGPQQDRFDLKETYTAKYNPLKALSGDYSLQIERDLRKKTSVSSPLRQLSRPSFGREIRRNQKADAKLTLRFFKWLDQSYTFQANYEEIDDPRRRQAQAVIDSVTGLPVRTIDITTKNNVSGRLNVRLDQVLKALGKPGAGRVRGGRGKAKSKDAGKGEAAAAEKKKPRPQQPFVLRRMVFFLGGKIDPVSANWKRNRDTRNFNLTGRPSLSYQLGLTDTLSIPRAAVGLTKQDQRNRNEDVEVSSGLKLPLGFSVKTNYKEQTTRRSGSTQRRLRVERKKTFPSVKVSWGRAERLPFIKRFLNSAQVNASIDGSESQQGEGDLRPRNLIQESNSDELRASWSGQWRWGPTTRIEFSNSKSGDTDFELASLEDSLFTGKPAIRGSGVNERNSRSMEVKYKLRPREMPLFGKLKSEVDLRLEFELESEKRTSATGEEQQAPLSASDKSKIELNATYRFSENFRGKGVIRLENNSNKLTEKTRKIREVRLAGTLFFR